MLDKSRVNFQATAFPRMSNDLLCKTLIKIMLPLLFSATD